MTVHRLCQVLFCCAAHLLPHWQPQDGFRRVARGQREAKYVLRKLFSGLWKNLRLHLGRINGALRSGNVGRHGTGRAAALPFHGVGPAVYHVAGRPVQTPERSDDHHFRRLAPGFQVDSVAIWLFAYGIGRAFNGLGDCLEDYGELNRANATEVQGRHAYFLVCLIEVVGCALVRGTVVGVDDFGHVTSPLSW